MKYEKKQTEIYKVKYIVQSTETFIQKDIYRKPY